ncbi:conserved hypothetical protein [Thiolapillus brandeum]|uniref:DUF4390 domain-containing protein n=2 Tax=Thiolapillus brandeum TaxID=1076588 RepID=A0A7U6GGR7_9GAMM|nr:conserved hypothetical protein [Thiolapillus brandeum]
MRLLMLLFLGFLSLAAQGASISFKAVAIGEQDGWIVLDLVQHYVLSDTMLEALENGVPLTFATEIVIDPEDASFWRSALGRRIVRRQLSFHPLAGEYEVLDLGAGTQRRFATRDAALLALGDLKGEKIIRSSALRKGRYYRVSIQTANDIGELPLPLRPKAYLFPGWHLSSKVYEWRLQP